MTEDEYHDLVELKRFLEKAIDEVDNALIFTDPNVSQPDYDFLIKKVKMCRQNLSQIVDSLNNR